MIDSTTRAPVRPSAANDASLAPARRRSANELTLRSMPPMVTSSRNGAGSPFPRVIPRRTGSTADQRCVPVLTRRLRNPHGEGASDQRSDHVDITTLPG
jgi:hypothetical protein